MARWNDRGAWNRYFVRLRTEGDRPALRAAAVGIGAFVGCQPIYGLHLAICVIVARQLGLNRVLTYLAANISNPLLAPFLTLFELQVGHFFRTGSAYGMTVTQLQALNLPSMAGDLVIGSLAVGALVGSIGAGLTYLSMNRDVESSPMAQAYSAAADRYIESGLWAWEFASQKLRHDPIYRYTLTGAALPSGGTLVDFGCGLGLALVFLRTVAALHRAGLWPAGSPPPCFARLVGVEPRPSVAATAARALDDGGTIVTMDGRLFEWPACDAVMFFDVLHLIPYEDQEQILTRARRSLREHGVVIVREADASMGAPFQLVRMINFLRSVAGGRLRPRFFFRSAEQWNALFIRAGFQSRLERPVSMFKANVAFRLTPASPGSSRFG